MSLLGSLYSRIRGSQEDLATLSLTYILHSSEYARKAFSKYLTDKIGLPERKAIQFLNQSAGDKQERPDISVISDGHEVALIEAKFYAGLTKNQPVTYLERLMNNKGSGILFICPTLRKQSLFSELLQRVDGSQLTELSHENYSFIVDSVKLTVVDWFSIIKVLETACATESSVLADIYQLRGLCEKLDSERDLPFAPHELERSRVREIMKLYSLPNLILDKLKTYDDLHIDSKGLLLSPRDNGISRYCKINGWGCDIVIDFHEWNDNKMVISPLWLTIKRIESKWIKPSSEISRKLLSFNTDGKTSVFDKDDAIWIALEIPLYIEIDGAAESISLLIRTIMNSIPSADGV